MLRTVTRLSAAICVLAAASASGLAQPQTPPKFLQQNWTAADRQMFYTTTQGSQMMPYSWFMALENANDAQPFRDSLPGFGYLPNPKAKENPDGLPVGFVRDTDNNGAWIVLTCAACHTSQINFAGRLLQIDGGPANADMFLLIDGAARALAATAASKNAPKFTNFARRVLPANAPQNDIDRLYDSLSEFSAGFTDYVKNSTSPVPWGRARLDAFGMIFNRVTAIDLEIPENNRPPDAPVSYPFLWETHWHNVVQWNGSAPNDLIIERLLRNVGEVLGVFAHASINKKADWPFLSVSTSANRANQLMIEQRLSKLRAPAWPRDLAPIDAVKARAGAILYKEHCLVCHSMATPGKRQEVKMTPLSQVLTDPRMATNAASRTSKTGVLEGISIPALPGVTAFGKEAPTLEIVSKLTLAATLAPLPLDEIRPLVSLIDHRQSFNEFRDIAAWVRAGDNQKKLPKIFELAQKAMDAQSRKAKELSYKARPLDGIWAAAPYLHNGSVPNLLQLLLPAAQREKQFWVGSREFDPAGVGFKTEQPPGASLLDTTLAGNSNAGHDGETYGTTKMDNVQRGQLLEYLKTL